ncbi:MAG: hypothetical protein ACM3S2_11260 [Ignavibacteriales bacterium]
MLKQLILVLFILFLFSVNEMSYAQGPKRKNFGFGIILGDPTGGTIKYWFNRENALAASLGGSYFGSPRLGVDYLWHFDAFQSSVAALYAGFGGVLGFGTGGSGLWYKGEKGKFYYRSGSDAGLGIRGVFGLNIIPERTPLEIFLEVGALVGLAPDFGSAIDLALGMRFYP